MPIDADIERLDQFLDETTQIYRAVVGRGRISAAERHLLIAALDEFVGQREALVNRYADLSDASGQDAGVVGLQLHAKVEIARKADPRADDDKVRTRKARRWIKRVKILAGSLKGLIPGYEALVELLDLLDSALDQ